MPRLLPYLLIFTLLACEYQSSREIRFDRRSAFGRVLVVDEGDRRHLRFGSPDSGNQGTISLSDPKAVPMEYIRFTLLGMLLAPKPERVLMVGLGGGTFTTLLRRHDASLWIDAVEIDPVVVQAAKEWFGVEEDRGFRIHVADGAAFIDRTPHSYDLIMLDIHTGKSTPEHLASHRFFEAVRSRLTPGGVAVLNVWDEGHREGVIENRFRATFSETACIRTSDGYNLVLFGRASHTMPDQETLIAAARKFTSDKGLSFDLTKVAKALRTECAKRQ
ncbi:MAG: fused MFS/spermidine synthase [Thermodesulfobacteriota bacterium]|nr:fused MFS/spermidine synthase [Thermodesulfobacteriota bacterium]